MGRTLRDIRADLALDLKVTEGTELTAAELNRCIYRAVADLSRFLPREKVYELTVDYDVEDESITMPAAASATAIVNAQSLFGETAGATIGIADTTPDVPRRLTVTLNDANYSITELTLIVKGYDQDGYYIEESWYLSGLKVSGTAYQGKIYFSRITQVELDNISHATAADTISVGTGNAYDSYVYLANKPIRPRSETVTNAAGTATARDTDYVMDYATGGIKYIDGGDIAAGEACTIDYTKSRITIDIDGIIEDFIRLHRVEYPNRDVPQTFINADIFAGVLTITGGRESQEEMTEAEHLAIYYYARHTPPAADAPGSYPAFLDNTIILAASAYALMIKALEYEHQAATELAAISHSNTTDALDNVDTYSAGATAPSAKKYLDDGDAIVAAISLTVASGYLTTGATKADLVNVGDRVAEIYGIYANAGAAIEAVKARQGEAYADYAQRANEISISFIQEAIQRNAINSLYVEEADRYSLLADRFRTEAIERRNEAWAIWRDPSQYIGDWVISQVRQATSVD